MTNNFKNKISLAGLALVLIFAGALAAPNSTQAQTQPDEVVMTWQAFNFYPSNYPGKAPATLNSEVVVSATILSGSQTVPSPNEFKWYIDGSFYKKGAGLQEISFSPELSSGSTVTVELVIGSRANGTTVYEDIPIREPKLVIQHRSPDGIVNGGSVSLRAIPYFFDVSTFEDLAFQWRINNQPQQTTSNQITIDLNDWPLAGSTGILVESTAVDSTNLVESASNQTMIYQSSQ